MSASSRAMACSMSYLYNNEIKIYNSCKGDKTDSDCSDCDYENKNKKPKKNKFEKCISFFKKKLK